MISLEVRCWEFLMKVSALTSARSMVLLDTANIKVTGGTSG